MKRISKLMLASMLSVALMFSSAMPAAAASDVLTATLSDSPVSKNVSIDTKCNLYGYVAITNGGAVGNPCHWLATQTGDLAATGTNTSVSFGTDGKYDNIMANKKMVVGGVVQRYEKDAGALHKYTSAHTMLNY